MRILYISPGGDSADYLRDCLLHGLRTLLGPDVVDAPRINVLYSDFPSTRGIYGSGFTLYRTLPDIPIDRDDIPAKLSRRYYDLVLWGSIHRCQDWLHEAISAYDPSRLVFIDGEDHPGYLSGLGGLWYFKRELYNPQPSCYPIHFGVPASKILPSAPSKSRLMAPCDPLDRSTYVYKTESDYYAQYASAYYAPTMKKAGWDCLRHYEILSQWTLPYFRVLDQLPALICDRLPRRELALVKLAIEYWKDSRSDRIHRLLPSLWESLIEPVMTVVRRDLTTESIALRVLDTIGVRHTVYSIPKEPVTA